MSKLSKSLIDAAVLAASLAGPSAIKAETITQSGDPIATPMGHGGMPMMQQMGQMMSQCSTMMKQHRDGNAAPEGQKPPGAREPVQP